MKKLVTVFAFILVSGVLFAGEYISQIWDIGTSAIFYGEPAVKEMNETLKKQDYKSLVLTGEYGLRFQLDSKIDFVLMGYLTCDHLGKGTSAILRLDYGITGGVRLRPGLGGIALGCEYCTGQRADINTIPADTITTTTQWGNGFRFTFEYDFSSLLSGIAPVIGVGYRSIPRGNNARDGNLAFYFRLVG